MNSRLAKNYIELIIHKWPNNLAHKKLLFSIIDILSIDRFKSKYIFDSDFEFSLLENNDNIRMLHLLFWKDKISQRNINIFIKNRQEGIIEIFKNINENFHREYNIEILKFFFAFNQKYCFYPVQFSLEYNRDLLFTILKVYLSITFQKFPLEKFTKLFGFRYNFLKKIFHNKQYDAIAIDFLENGDYKFKFYAISNNHGFLYRVERPFKIISIKNYIRIPEGIPLSKIPLVFAFKIDKNIKKFIKRQGFKIHYLAKEKNVKSCYFR